MSRVRVGLLVVVPIAVLIFIYSSFSHGIRTARPRLVLEPTQIYADGADTATLTITAPHANGAPRITIQDNPHAASLLELTHDDANWQIPIRAGVLAARVTLRVQFPGQPAATAQLVTLPTSNDTFSDGTPDFLRLDTDHDRRTFRRWFTFLAEAQYFQDPVNRPAEINDCAALIRYAYREALHAHETGWAEAARLPLVPSFSPIAKYQYPYTPLGAGIFRVQEGPYRTADLTTNAFAQFADVKTLVRYNTHLVSRDLNRAVPGDLLFFRQDSDHMPFHSMIYLGESPLRPDGNRYVLYHTGPDSDSPGIIRRLTLDELLRFPQPEWRPQTGNQYFLGVYRWNILRKASELHDAL